MRRTPILITLFTSMALALSAVSAATQVETTPEATPEAAETIPCAARTEAANTVQVRVGPGANRTVFVYLPAAEDFVVLGQAEADDGSLWWKLDRAVVAPRKSAAEAWVSQADVETTGDCDAVTDVNAPPIIPILGVAPAADANGTPAAVPVNAVLPQAGTWTLAYPATAAGTCGETEKTASMTLNWPPESWLLSVAGDGASITFAGKTFRRTRAGLYAGTTTLTRLSPTAVARMTLRVTSPEQMAVRLTFDFPVDGSMCSFTVNATMAQG